jgi:hypothetical protein
MVYSWLRLSVADFISKFGLAAGQVNVAVMNMLDRRLYRKFLVLTLAILVVRSSLATLWP